VHYILYVSLEGFFVNLKAPGRSEPIAVVRDNRVLDVNSAARGRGITAGMEKRTARAVAHEIQFFVWEEDLYEEASAKWLDLCTEFTGIIEPEEQNSAHLDLSAHPNAFDVAEKVVRTLAQETGLRIFYGASCSKWIAKLACQQGDCGAAAIDPAAFLSALPIHCLTPIRDEYKQRLNFLGYRSIGDILSIPENLLRQQFGVDGLFLSKAAQGDVVDLPLAIYPRDSLIETLFFDGAVDSLETIDLALRDLAGRAATRLSSKSLQGQEVLLSVEFENGETKQLRRRFSKPVHSFLGAFTALRLLFSEITTRTPPLAQSGGGVALPDASVPVDSPSISITSLRLALTNLQARREKQTALLGRAKGDSSSAVNVVRTVFGDASVQLGAEIPIPRRVRVLREWKNAIGWS